MAWMERGTSCRFCWVLRAVTTTSSSPRSSSACCACTTPALASKAPASGTPRNRVRECLPPRRRIFRSLLRVMLIPRFVVVGGDGLEVRPPPSVRQCMPFATESKLRRRGIPVEHLAKRSFERIQVRLIVPPLVHALLEYGPTHLFGAGGADGPLVLVELEHGGLEFQAAVGQQAAHLGLGILHHVLVEHAVHPPGQHLVEMRHELYVIAVVPPDLGQVVRKTLPAREMLLEAGQAAAQRMPARIDDLRVRQHQVDEPQ